MSASDRPCRFNEALLEVDAAVAVSQQDQINVSVLYVFMRSVRITDPPQLMLIWVGATELEI